MRTAATPEMPPSSSSPTLAGGSEALSLRTLSLAVLRSLAFLAMTSIMTAMTGSKSMPAWRVCRLTTSMAPSSVSVPMLGEVRACRSTGKMSAKEPLSKTPISCTLPCIAATALRVSASFCISCPSSAECTSNRASVTSRGTDGLQHLVKEAIKAGMELVMSGEAPIEVTPRDNLPRCTAAPSGFPSHKACTACAAAWARNKTSLTLPLISASSARRPSNTSCSCLVILGFSAFFLAPPSSLARSP
mmetsp:Transcript_61843/g.100062  ORF Transcript_61843/g.100062 Transcript_61843/m.100062 type:complete len:246 (-) Transcript_61843:1121-1858(-)